VRMLYKTVIGYVFLFFFVLYFYSHIFFCAITCLCRLRLSNLRMKRRCYVMLNADCKKFTHFGCTKSQNNNGSDFPRVRVVRDDQL